MSKITLQRVTNDRTILRDIISSGQSQLHIIALSFSTSFIIIFYIFRDFIVENLKKQTLSEGATVNAITAFDVVLLQTKVSLIGAAIVAMLTLLYVSRDTLQEHGLFPGSPLPRWQLVVLSVSSVLLFVGSLLYSYYLFFPMLFQFLTSNILQSGLQPHYSIVKWFTFLALLSLAMGLAAELPLIMMVLSYAEIVSYEVFVSKWRHAVVVITVIASVINGSPDPFSMALVAVPMTCLYIIGLGVSKLVVTIKYSREQISLGRIILGRWVSIVTSALVAGVLAYEGVVLGYGATVDAYLYRLPYEMPSLFFVEWIFALPRELATIVFGVTVAFLVASGVVLIQLFRAIDATAARRISTPAPASAGDPRSLDLTRLDAASVAVAPVEAFVAMTEDEALDHAAVAMETGNPPKAQAILDRFDAAQEVTTGRRDPTEIGSAASELTEADADVDGGDVATQTTTGMINSFTEVERSEDDIGGYFYDIQFILDSLTSKMFRIIGLFMLVTGVVFTVLYTGGLTILKEDFLRRLPPGIRADQIGVVALHPVEALVFEMKLSAVIGVAVTLPILLYYAWPALNERGIGDSNGSRGFLLMWACSTLIALIGGSIIGYAIVAPAVISWLTYDALQANMLIKYQINAAGWLVFFTTVGIGLLATIPTTLLFLHHGGFVPFPVLRQYWRETVVGIIGVITVAAPGGVFGMLLFSFPVVGAYLLGLGVLWVYTLGRRRAGPLTKSKQA